jgi:uncharacterized linocin/CFP29 family protein
MDAKTIKKRLEKIVKDAKEAGYSIIVNADSWGLLIVTNEEYDKAEDLRKLEGQYVELPTCGCPGKHSYDCFNF